VKSPAVLRENESRAKPPARRSSLLRTAPEKVWSNYNSALWDHLLQFRVRWGIYQEKNF